MGKGQIVKVTQFINWRHLIFIFPNRQACAKLIKIEATDPIELVRKGVPSF